MKKKKSQRSKRKSVTVPTTSMGDIAFLLIIFFLVASEITKDNSSVKVQSPVSPHVQKTEIDVVARVAVDETGTIYLDSEVISGPKDIEWALRAMLAKTVSDEQRHVQFRCDANLPKEQFEPVIKAIAEAGGIIEAVGELQE